MKIVTAAEMREIDRLTTEQYGVPSLTLMENAGSAVAEFAQKHFDFKTVCLVCGKGNNGGDGFVAARKLQEAGKQVSVIILAKGAGELRGDAAEMFRKLSATPLWVSEESDFEKAEVQQALRTELIVDAILGTGFKPPLKGIAATVIKLINGLAASVVAVDLPSGVDADSMQSAETDAAIRADGVITFTAPKPVHVFAQVTAGPLAVAQIGSPAKLVHEQARSQQEVLSLDEIAQTFPPRAPDAHKGSFGHVLVIGGSVGKSGAAAMAGLAALRAGAGLVTVACPKSVQPVVASYAPEIMTQPLPETSEGTIALRALEVLQRLAEEKSCLAIGPGLSRNPETAELVRQLLKSTETCAVVDADGLNAFENHTQDLSGEGEGRRVLVLTPHPGEMARLTGLSTREIQSNRVQTASDAAKKYRAIVVLKGHRTIIATPAGPVWINMSGNPGMAKGGTGDVLTGVTAAVLAPHANEIRNNELSAARYVATAVHLHGLAGDLARDLYGEESMLATDMIECLGDALALYREESQDKFAYLQR